MLDFDSSKVQAGPTEFLLKAQARTEKTVLEAQPAAWPKPRNSGSPLGDGHDPGYRSPFRFPEARRKLNEGE